MSLSDSIKLIRQKNLLNQQEFADVLKVGLTTVNRWEGGKSIPNISAMKKIKAFCEDNGFLTKHKTPRPQVKAEVLYKYITGNLDFVESHTGLEDVLIEAQILKYCFAKHKKMRKECFS